MQVSLLLVAWLQNSMRNSFAPRPSFPVLGIQISSFRSVVELQVVHSLPSYCQSWGGTKVFRDAPGNGVEGGHEADDGSDLRWRCFDDDAVDALRMATEL